MHLEVHTRILAFRNIVMSELPSFNFQTGFCDHWCAHYTASVLINRMLCGYNNEVGPLPQQIASFLCHTKDIIEDCRCVQYTLNMRFDAYWADRSVYFNQDEGAPLGISALNNGSMCNGRAR